MSGGSRRQPRPSGQRLLIILFTDIEDSTALTQQLGDARAQAQIVQIHNTFVREAMARCSGSEIKHTGDGIMASFPSAAAAISCAIAIQEQCTVHNSEHPNAAFNVRIGLNAGEPIVEDEDLYGTAVQMAARICAHAAPGLILASDVVRQLAAGKDVAFNPHPAQELKGFGGPVPLFEVIPQEGAAHRLWPVPGAEAQSQRAWPRRPARKLVLPVTVVAIVAGAALAAFAVSGAFDDGGGAQPVLREFVTEMENVATLSTISGDCATSDLVVTGTVSGTVTGHFIGESGGPFDARLYAVDDCLRTKANNILKWDDGAGNTLSLVSTSVSLRRAAGLQEGVASSSQADRAASLIVGGTGKYAGVTGTGTCLTLAFILGSSASPASTARATSDCTHQLRPAGDSDAVILQAVASVEEMTVTGSSTDLPYEATIVILYKNNGDGPLTGLSLRLIAPKNVELRATKLGVPFGDNPAALVWPLPDLEPKATGQLEVVLQVASSGSAAISLVPEIAARDLGGAARGRPVDIKIVQ